MGFGTDGPDNGPWNMSFPMVAPFQILGPSKNPYPGTVCLPQVPLPANTTVQPGDNATIQVVELAVHGASLFSVSFLSPVCLAPAPARWDRRNQKKYVANMKTPQCVDITFVEPGDERLEVVNETNCFNSNDIGFADVYTIVTREVDADPDISARTSGAAETAETVFWYFGRHGGRGTTSVWNFVGLAPVALGLAWALF